MKEKGFTLVELLVVIAIIGILLGLVVAALDPVAILNRSRHGVLKANVGRVCQAGLACYTAMSTQPSCDTVAETGVTLPSGVGITGTTGAVVGGVGTCSYSCNITTGVITVSAGTCYAP